MNPWVKNAIAMGFAVVLPALLAIPAIAQPHVVQNACRTDGPYPVVHFSIVNPATTSFAVCRMTVVPATAHCFPLQCGTPNTWTCFPGDVTTFFQAGATPGDCVAPGETQAGFSFALLGNACCFRIGFFSEDGAHFAEQDVCFECDTVGVERRTWGRAKQLYD